MKKHLKTNAEGKKNIVLHRGSVISNWIEGRREPPCFPDHWPSPGHL